MRRILLLVVLGLAIVTQVSLLPALRPFDAVPNLMLVLVILIGLRGTVSEALLLAVIGGVVMDLASGSDFGRDMGVLVLGALSTGLVRRSGLSLTGPLVAVGLVAVMTLAAAAVSLAGILDALSASLGGRILAILAGELVLNLLLTLGLRPIINRLVPDESALPTIG